MTESKSLVSKITILLSIFFISVSLFIYQVVLTRIYSVMFSYHYVFLITSFAIFGLGIGSIIAYMRRNRIRKISRSKKAIRQSMAQQDIRGQINEGSIILSTSYTLVFILHYFLPFVNNLAVYIVLGIVPFIIAGYLYSILFMEFSGISGKLYFADLIGSGAGSVVVILLLNSSGMSRTIVAICIIALIPALILTAINKKVKAVGYILTLILIAGFLLPGHYISSIEKNFDGILSNTNKTFGLTKRAGGSPEIVFSDWNAFSRTDVLRFPDDPDKMILTIDGAANSPMHKFNGDLKSLEKFKTDTGFLPFTVGANNKTLLIGPGGGRDVLYALAGGSKEITAVEINTSSTDAVKLFGDYNGNIYDRPEVKVYGGDGRSFVRKSEDKYDLIFLSLVMTSSSQSAGYALSEDYIYTVEAVKDYLDHLDDNGKIAFLLHGTEDLTKITVTAIKALEEKGISAQDAPKYMATLAKSGPQEHGGTHMQSPVLIVKNKPFDEEESKGLLETASKTKDSPIYIPLVFEEGVLHHIQVGHATLNEYINGVSINVAPATDNSPYFYKYNRGIPSTLVFILIVAIIGGVALFAYFVIHDGSLKPTIYFSLLGVGYMMIEVPLIQKFILYLGHPTLAFTYVLASLLIGCGIGGYLSNYRLFNRTLKVIYLPAILVALISIILLVSLDLIFQATSTLGLTGRIIVASLIVMSQGFFMGMPFPRGLKLVGESGRGEIVPVMWGINGVTSVIGSVLSIILSMLIGFTGALIVGAMFYLVVSLYKTL